VSDSSLRSAAITVAELLRSGRSTLERSDSPALDAELLLAGALKTDRAALYREPDLAVPAQTAAQFRRNLAVRASGRPIAQILGHAEFWSLQFDVDDHVLIPRPETEQLVEMAIARTRPAARIADLGTGSGAIAVAISREVAGVQLIATDYSTAALRVAARNASRLDAQQIAFVRTDWLAGFADGCLDLIVSNPPYIDAADPLLTESDIRFEPLAALAAGPDGLDAIRAIVREAPRVLKPGGELLLEHGYNQAAAVRDLMRRHRFVAVASKTDLGGHDRITSGRTVAV